MAELRGTDGVLKVGGTAIGNVKNWSVSIQRSRIKTTAKGDDFETSLKGVGSWRASVELHCDFADAVQNTARAAATSGVDLACIFFPGGDVVDLKKYTGNAVVTNMEIGSPDPGSTDPVNCTLELEGNGALVEAAVT